MEKPPAYSEYAPSPALSPSTLPQHLTEVRTIRLNNTITDQILPQFQTAVTSGLSNTTLVLLPSSAEDSQQSLDAKSSSSAPEVLGFPSTENVSVIRLEGEENTLEFWRQLTVARELESMLKSHLDASGHRVWVPRPTMRSPTAADKLSSTDAKQGGQFFRRKQSSSRSNVSTSPTGTGYLEASWASPRPEPLSPGEIRVDVQLKDIPMRIVTDMGLYETRTGKGVVVKMEIGG
ncbi:hypothetical protein MMC10_005414 [Thelotrema lepadinum]|nr:hypothetical protein [Thelotrema lepadinum]